MKRCQYILIVMAFLTILPVFAQAWVRGIYVTQPTLESTRTIKYLIRRSKAVGISTFVIDYYRNSKRTRRNIQLVKKAGIHYVARIAMFPHGARPHQIRSKKYLARRYAQIQAAIKLGAEKIQLDYIRYHISQRGSEKNACNIYNIIKTVRSKIPRRIGLEVDVFGEAAHIHSKHIGQHAPLFAPVINAICPMVYPSHYYPYRFHSQRPYQTIYKSLTSCVLP